MKIEFQNETLNSDSWVLDIVTNIDYKQRIIDLLEDNAEIDLFDAMMHDYLQNGSGENDQDLYNRILNVKKLLANQRDARTGDDLEKKILVVSHGMTMKALFSSGVEPDKPSGKGFKNSLEVSNCQIVPLFLDQKNKVWS